MSAAGNTPGTPPVMNQSTTELSQLSTLRQGSLGAPERVYSGLRDRILSFELPPGTILDRKSLSDSYGVSQTPVRDALLRLAQDGLVQIFPQSKTLVSRIDVRQLSETQFLRVATETEVVRRLTLGRREGTLRKSEAILQMQSALAETGEEMDMFTELDRRFHRALFEGVGMASLHSMLIDRLGHLYRCQRLELPRSGKMQAIVQAHREIIDGIRSKDPENAMAAMRDHLSGTISRIESLRRDHPDFFSDDALIDTQFG